MGDDHDSFGKGMRAMEAARKADKKYGITELHNQVSLRGDLLTECVKFIRYSTDFSENFGALELVKRVEKELKED
jgi:hypothetical protein